MAEQMFFMADNLYSQRLYPNHTISANEEPTGFEATQVANCRRSSIYRWQASTANADAHLTVRCDQLRSANCLIIDRGHNLAGETVALRGSSDNFSTYRSIFSVTIPSVPGGAFTNGVPLVTDEGAVIIPFAADAHHDWRVFISAMGAGLVPQIVGLWLGFAFIPATTARLSYLPHDDETFTATFEETASPYGWVGESEGANPRTGILKLKHHANDGFEDIVRWQIMGQWAKARYRAWLIMRRTDAPHRAMLVRCQKAPIDYRDNVREWPGGRTLEAPFIEDQPLAEMA